MMDSLSFLMCQLCLAFLVRQNISGPLCQISHSQKSVPGSKYLTAESPTFEAVISSAPKEFPTLISLKETIPKNPLGTQLSIAYPADTLIVSGKKIKF